jgi:hypothetical protein
MGEKEDTLIRREKKVVEREILKGINIYMNNKI